MFSIFRNFLPFAQARADASNKTNTRERVFVITKEQFNEPIKDEYAKKLSLLTPEEIYDNYNPGPVKEDGSINFECHCVSHLVGSPCGYAFRKVLICQKSTPLKELEEGACAEEFMEFMQCAMKTQCFRMKDDDNGERGSDSTETSMDIDIGERNENE